MPIGPPEDPDRFEDFDACWQTLLEGDNDIDTEEAAKRVCGAWQNRVEGNVEIAVNELGEVKEVEEGGKTWLVAPAKFIKNMELHRGYVPKEHIVGATERWNSTPIVADHPRVGPKQFISVNSPMSDVETFGEIRHSSTTVNGAATTAGQAWFDVEAAQAIGGEAKRIVDGLKAGKTYGVSAAYTGDDLPPGEYDGEHRDKVKGNIEPDHVAVFESKNGRCTIRDGCMVGDVAANEVFVNITNDGSGDDVTTPEELEEHMTDDLSLSRTGDEITVSGTFDEKELEDKSMKDSILKFLGLSTDDDSAESEEKHMSEKTELLVNEHGFEEENLPDEDTACFQKIYDLAVNESSEEDDTSEEEAEVEEEETSEDGVFDPDELLDRMEERFVTKDDLTDTVAEAISANQEVQKKERLVDEIIANSDYDEDDKDDLMDTPEHVLSDLRAKVQPVADWRGSRGAGSARPSTEGTKMPALSANERIKELEADD